MVRLGCAADARSARSRPNLVGIFDGLVAPLGSFLEAQVLLPPPGFSPPPFLLVRRAFNPSGLDRGKL